MSSADQVHIRQMQLGTGLWSVETLDCQELKITIRGLKRSEKKITVLEVTMLAWQPILKGSVLTLFGDITFNTT